MDNSKLKTELNLRVSEHLSRIYPDTDHEALARQVIETMGGDRQIKRPRWQKNNWSQQDVAVISYANTFTEEDKAPLSTLYTFLARYLAKEITWVHILPFFPFSSDDGFAVTDYKRVNEAFGTWEHVGKIARKFKVMSDLVINHCSAMHEWFTQFKNGDLPGRGYFYTVPADYDASNVVRPRTTPLLREVQTEDGIRYVWCTFSHDQVDLNFENPEVLIEIVRIIRFYLDKGIKIFRLDAIAFIWKREGTTCLNLEETHEIVRLIRTLIEYYQPGTVIITETNIPNQQNLSYFGNANETHLIYNFSLPPLLLNTLVTGNCYALKSWMMAMPPARKGTTFLNFIASHDGIGLRPLEGLVEQEEIDHLIATMELQRGSVSWRSLGKDGEMHPYEINISLFDALRGTVDNPEDGHQERRFICAHSIMLSLEGVPAFYIHSLIATGNDYEKLAQTNNPRAINRHNWKLEEIENLLATDTHHARIFHELKRLIEIRKRQPAFHPNAIMFTLHIGDHVFAYWRQSLERDQSIFCLNNVTGREQTVSLHSLNLVSTDSWWDLITDEPLDSGEETFVLAPYQSAWLTNAERLAA